MKFSTRSAFLILAMLVPAGCSERPSTSIPELDPARIYKLAEKITAVTPRHSGTPGVAKTAEFIADCIRDSGLEPETDAWTALTPDGPVDFRNVYARLNGKNQKFIILGAHYDNKKLETVPDFSGANDGASGVALLLEIIRALSSHNNTPPFSMLFAFFDGEECVMNYSDNDGLYGSRHLAEKLEKKGELKQCRAVIILDMIGDKDLKLTIPADTDPDLFRILRQAAKKHGLENVISKYHTGIIDDHTPFSKKGVPAVNLIDFEYGPGNHYWHTAADTMDKISAESMRKTGILALELIYRIP